MIDVGQELIMELINVENFNEVIDFAKENPLTTAGVVLTGGQIATAEQIDAMISSAVLTAEKYYPAFQLVVYDNQSPNKAMQVAIAEAYGHA